MTIIQDIKQNWKMFGTSNTIEFVEMEDGMINVADRWTFDPSLGSILLLSKEFLESIMCYTHITDIEWGGFIVGEDLKYVNIDTGQICRVLICERAIVLGQARSGASFDIPADVVSDWVENDDYEISEQSFKTVYIDNGWKKIGWVHSHHTMGTFWSYTDNTTIADFDMPGIVSIVVAKLANGIERRIRCDKHEYWFGGVLRPYRDEIDTKFVVEEEIFGGIEDISEETKKYYENILSKVDTINGIIETAKTSKAHTSTAAHYAGTTAYSRSPYSRTMSIGEFLVILAPEEVACRLSKPYGLELQTTMNIVVNKMHVNEIIDIVEKLYKEKQLIGQLTFNFKNFKEHIRDFVNAVNFLSEDIIKSIETAITVRQFPINWQDILIENLQQKESFSWYSVKDDMDAEDLWQSYGKDLPDDVIAQVIDTISTKDFGMDVLEELIRKRKTNIRASKEIESIKVVELIRMFEKTIENLDIEHKEKGKLFIYSLIADMVEPLVEKYSSPNKGVAYLINAMNDNEIDSFLSRYVALYDTEEDLMDLKNLGKIVQYKKEYYCEICKTAWETQKGANECTKVCGKKRDEKGDGIKMVEAKSTTGVYDTFGRAMIKTIDGDISEKLPRFASNPTALDIIVSNVAALDDSVILGVEASFYETHRCMYCGLLYPTHALAYECETECSRILDVYYKLRYQYCPICLSDADETKFDDTVDQENLYYVEHSLYCDEKGLMLYYILKDCLLFKSLDSLYDHLENRDHITEAPLLIKALLRDVEDPELLSKLYDIPKTYTSWLFSEEEEITQTVGGIATKEKNVSVEKNLDTESDAKDTCHICGEVQNYLDYLLWHIAEEHDCKYKYIEGLNEDALQDYLLWVYDKVDTTGEPFFQCVYCKKTFDGIKARFQWYKHEKEHEKEHEDERI